MKGLVYETSVLDPDEVSISKVATHIMTLTLVLQPETRWPFGD